MIYVFYCTPSSFFFFFCPLIISYIFLFLVKKKKHDYLQKKKNKTDFNPCLLRHVSYDNHYYYVRLGIHRLDISYHKYLFHKRSPSSNCESMLMKTIYFHMTHIQQMPITYATAMMKYIQQ